MKNNSAMVSDYINSAPDGQKQIMESIRDLIYESVPQVKEEFKWGRPVFSNSSDFAYLKKAKNYVTLGFFNFQKLDDNKNLLEGSGKDMRHIKIRSIQDVDKEMLKRWFQASAF